MRYFFVTYRSGSEVGNFGYSTNSFPTNTELREAAGKSATGQVVITSIVEWTEADYKLFWDL